MAYTRHLVTIINSNERGYGETQWEASLLRYGVDKGQNRTSYDRFLGNALQGVRQDGTGGVANAMHMVWHHSMYPQSSLPRCMLDDRQEWEYSTAWDDVRKDHGLALGVIRTY